MAGIVEISLRILNGLQIIRIFRLLRSDLRILRFLKSLIRISKISLSILN